jgi:hypothetical protein
MQDQRAKIKAQYFSAIGCAGDLKRRLCGNRRPSPIFISFPTFWMRLTFLRISGASFLRVQSPIESL